MTLDPQLPDRAVDLARSWVTSREAQRRPDRAAARLADLLADPDGVRFTLAFVDRVVRPEDPRVAAAALRHLAADPPAFLSGWQRFLLRCGAYFSRWLPEFVIRRARTTLRSLVGHLVVDARPERLGPALQRLRARGDRVNVNVLGEAVLGHEEADRRLDTLISLVGRPDIDYISVKVSAVVSHLAPWDVHRTVDRVVARLTPLYAAAVQASTPTFINLDMEEYADLEVTLLAFTRVMDAFPDLRAGIVLQAYLPDSLAALQALQLWAHERHLRGGAPIKVRIVKGANLAMERVEAERRGWPQATWPTKVDTDASYKTLLAQALDPDRTPGLRIGLAGHNLFDLAWAWLLAGDRGVQDAVDVEMLLGLDTGAASAAKRTVGGVTLYTPVVHPDEFDVAIAYLVRRLDECASPENFIRSIAEVARDAGALDHEEERFRASIAAMATLESVPRRTQDRSAETPGSGAQTFANTPDTDPSRPANRAWAVRALERTTYAQVGALTVADSSVHGPASLETLVRRCHDAAATWQAREPELRSWHLHQAGHALAARRGDLLTIMALEGGKTITEADTEISEAVDFAHYYAESLRRLTVVDGAHFRPDRVTVVTPPWNFPVAITAGSVLAALAAGSAVILKPAPQTPRCAAVVAETLWQAGIPRDLLRLVVLPEGDLSRDLITHPLVDRVLLTGSFETARLFKSWRPDLPLLAETSGKNALVITPSADIDLAVRDLVQSAFGHAGQKCSAASLGILVGHVAESERFRRQLLDAVNSLVVGASTDLSTDMGPLIEPPGTTLLSGLTELSPGETWLVEPRQLDADGRRWSPGVRIGVQPGSEAHRSEYFGPVLSLMAAPDLETAVAWQNGTDFGLTAGLHSLDADEIAWWLDRVEAGNLYVNRGTTGAIVQRQPFGGWKQSAVGPTAKAGGPNFLTRLGRWENAPLRRRRADAELDAFIVEELSQVLAYLLPAELTWVEYAAHSDQVAWQREFGRFKDVTGLESEANVLRYRPVPVTVRSEGPLHELVRVSLAARRCGAPLIVSSATPIPRGLADTVHLETHDAWLERLRRDRPMRVRLLSASLTDAAAVIDGDPAVTFYADPVTGSGRIECLPFLREQAISLTRHRYGHVNAEFESLLQE